MIFDTLRNECVSAFGYLTEEYGYRLSDSMASGRGFSVSHKSDIVGVRVAFQIGDPLLVHLFILEDGEFPPKIGEPTPHSVFRKFDLRDLEAVSGVRPVNEWIDDFAIPSPEVIRLYAQRLRVCCDALLRGDLAIVPAAQARVLDRARAAAFDKWGARATDYGW